MTPPSAPATIRPRTDISWVTDTHRVVIATDGGRRAQILEGTEATVWSWLTRSHRAERLIEFVAALERRERDAAAQRVDDLLSSWVDAGLLERGGRGSEELDHG